MTALIRLFVLLALVGSASSAFAVWPLPPYSRWPCNPANPGECIPPDPHDCFAYKSYQPRQARQFKTGDGRSPLSTFRPSSPYGVCGSGAPYYCQADPKLGTPSIMILPNPSGGSKILFTVPYQFPNNYCQVYDDGPPCNAGVWPSRTALFIGPVTRLILTNVAGQTIYTAPAIFENGRWRPWVSQCTFGTFEWNIFAVASQPGLGCTAKPDQKTIRYDVPQPEYGCFPDRKCAPCDSNHQPTSNVAEPINVGSGDVSMTERLFTIQQTPMPLDFTLNYHSSHPFFPEHIQESLGTGWTHSFDAVLKMIDPDDSILYHVNPEGHEAIYEGPPGGPWLPSQPAELTGRVVVTRVAGNYQMTELTGDVTVFDGATGRWLSSRDRWGNTIAGTYQSGVLTTVTDSVGRQIAFAYTGGRLTQVTLPTGQAWRFAQTGGALTSIFDPIHNGPTPWRTIEYQPDARGVLRYLTAMRDDSGTLLHSFGYDGSGRGITYSSDGGRDSVVITYGDMQTRVDEVVDAGVTMTSHYTLKYAGGRFLPTKVIGNCATCGGATDSATYVYDPNNRVTSRVDANGHALRFTYAGNGNLLTHTEAAGTGKERTTRFFYGHGTWPTYVTETREESVVKTGAWRTTTRSWNANETVLTESESGYLSPSDAAPTTFTRVSTYDARHRLLSIDGPRTDVQDVSTMSWYPDDDADLTRRGRLKETRDPVGSTTTADDYDIYGTARRTTDPNGVVIQLQTDPVGRLLTTTSLAVPGDPRESRSYQMRNHYDTRDRLEFTVSPSGNTTRFVYEPGTNRRTDVVRVAPGGNEMERSHRAFDRIGGTTALESQSCAVPAPVCSSWVTKWSESYGHDSHHRVTERRYAVPAGAKTVYAYDADGLLASVRDENHTSPNIRFAYDALHRLTAVTRTLAGAPGGVAVTLFEYDLMNNRRLIVDPNGNTTSFTYDDFRRMVREDSPVKGTTTYTYDPAGNLLTVTDARGAVTTRTYDASDRILSSTATLGAQQESIVYTYDDPTPGNYGRGRLATMTDPTGTTAYAYERRGLLRLATKSILGDTYTTAFEYDDTGNRAAITYPSGRRLAYTYDFADRPFAVTGTLNGVITRYVDGISYLPFGPQQTTTYGNAALLRSEDFDARYQTSRIRVTSNGIAAADYSFTHDAAGNITAINDALDTAYSRSFGYDDLNRLVRADTGAALWRTATYSYDPLGNVLSQNVGGRSSTFAYATQGSTVTSRVVSIATGGSTRAVVHDAAGNEQQIAGASFDYSPRNLLDRGDGIRYLYDGTGLRVAQVGVTVGPLITLQPLSQSVCPGAAAKLIVSASGAASYQWQAFGTAWTDIPGATSPTYAAAPTAATQYRVIVSNAAASTTSDVATVTPTALAVEPTSGVLYGDANRDGLVDGADVIVLRSVLTGRQALAVPQVVVDLNGDARLDALDLALSSAFATRQISCLPAIPAAAAASTPLRTTPKQAALNPTQYFFYLPELHLLSTTELKAGGGRPQIAVDYIWLNGTPIAEERIVGGQTRLTVSDHLGTPFLQTDAAGTVVWRAEYEPFGAIYRVRAGTAAEQRLRLPGQEFDEQTPERSYNVFRWYRSAWGRYTQADPFAAPRGSEPNVYAYVAGNPVTASDPWGLIKVNKNCYCAPNGYDFGNPAKDIPKACSYAKNPGCKDLLKKLSFPAPGLGTGSKSIPLDQCIEKRCKSPDFEINCAKGLIDDHPGACGKPAYDGSGITLLMSSGTGDCYWEASKTWAPVIFHEMIHSCGLWNAESWKDNAGPLDKAFKKIMETCAGVPF